MDYPEALSYLDAHIGRGFHPGLERITDLLDMMGNPEDSYPIVHVAGTNGKTSVARMVSRLTSAHGLTTGTFTSPHLERVEERLSLHGVMATPDQFAQAVTDAAGFAEIYEQRSGQRLSYFEITTAMALAWFAVQAVDVAVIEVGLGGRLDATNAVRGEVAVLTSVAIDHTEYLGTDLETIAAEKLAIVKPGAVLVTGPVPSAIDPLIAQVGRERAGQVHRYPDSFKVEGTAVAVDGWDVDIAGIFATYQDILLPVHGRHQTINLAVAVAAAEGLIGRELDNRAVVEAISGLTTPGRMEKIGSRPLVLIDGAHNVEGFSALAGSLAEEFPTIRWTLIMAAMDDKNVAGMLAHLAGRVDSVVATRVDSPRALPPEAVAEAAALALSVPVEVIPSPVEAVERARQVAAERAGAVLVTGSLYLVGAVRAALAARAEPHRNER